MTGYMYILECSDGSYYTGSTTDLELRLEQHQNGEGANHTRKRLPVKLVYYEEYSRIDEAFYREKQVQGWNRKKKEALIKGEHEKLPELSLAYRDLKLASDINSLASGTSANGTVPELLPEAPTPVPEALEGTFQKSKPMSEPMSLSNCEWKEYKFSDFVQVNPSVKINDEKEISFVEMKDLEDGKRFCEPNQFRLLSGGSRFQNGDTLFARITPCLENGKICQVRNLKNGVGFGSTEFHVFRGKDVISDTTFVFYLSRWNEVRDHAEKNFDGTSGRQRVPKQAFDDLFLSLPPLPEQQAIASVLSSLDDKIDLLHRQNKTLESMAETLFRQWFVLRQAQQPQSFPELNHWKEVSLFNAIELMGGGTPKTSVPEYWDGNIKWLSGGDIANNHKGIIVSSEKTITQEGLKNSSAKLLPRFSTVISARGTVGKYCILSEPMAFSQSNYGIKPKYNNCYFFTYLLINYSVEELQSAAYGSVFDTITTNTFKGLFIQIPSETEIQEFENLIKPYFLKISNNQTQILTLSKLRDSLLPKLMSGEVRVKV